MRLHSIADVRTALTSGELPATGVLSILCDGSGKPRALVEVSGVTVIGDEVVESFKVVYQA